MGGILSGKNVVWTKNGEELLRYSKVSGIKFLQESNRRRNWIAADGRINWQPGEFT